MRVLVALAACLVSSSLGALTGEPVYLAVQHRASCGVHRDHYEHFSMMYVGHVEGRGMRLRGGSRLVAGTIIEDDAGEFMLKAGIVASKAFFKIADPDGKGRVTLEAATEAAKKIMKRKAEQLKSGSFVPTKFTFIDTGNQAVSLVGTWSGWLEEHEMKLDQASGAWTVTIDIPPGNNEITIQAIEKSAKDRSAELAALALEQKKLHDAEEAARKLAEERQEQARRLAAEAAAEKVKKEEEEERKKEEEEERVKREEEEKKKEEEERRRKDDEDKRNKEEKKRREQQERRLREEEERRLREEEERRERERQEEERSLKLEAKKCRQEEEEFEQRKAEAEAAAKRLEDMKAKQQKAADEEEKARAAAYAIKRAESDELARTIHEQSREALDQAVRLDQEALGKRQQLERVLQQARLENERREEEERTKRCTLSSLERLRIALASMKMKMPELVQSTRVASDSVRARVVSLKRLAISFAASVGPAFRQEWSDMKVCLSAMSSDMDLASLARKVFISVCAAMLALLTYTAAQAALLALRANGKPAHQATTSSVHPSLADMTKSFVNKVRSVPGGVVAQQHQGDKVKGAACDADCDNPLVQLWSEVTRME